MRVPAKKVEWKVDVAQCLWVLYFIIRLFVT
jgi:hypothetical protein